MIHAHGKHRKSTTYETAEKCIGRDGTVGVERVAVDYVVEALHEYNQNPGADGDYGDDLGPGGDVWGGGPGEPEESCWKLIESMG